MKHRVCISRSIVSFLSLPFFVACAGGSSGTAGDSASSLSASTNASAVISEGAQVAELRLDAPQETSFVLRGVIPVPEGAVVGASSTWLGVRDHLGIVPAQLERVSRYPSGAAASYEVIARVSRDPSLPAGSPCSFPIHTISYAQGSPVTTGPVSDLPQPIEKAIRQTRSILFRAEDCHGNVYLAGPLAQPNRKSFRGGEFMETFRGSDSFRPLATATGATASVNRLMGIQAYLTTLASEGVLGIDIRVENGAVAFDLGEQDPIQKVYFRSLEILCPPGFSVLQGVQDPYFDPVGVPTSVNGKSYTAYSIVAPLSDNRMHVLPKRGQFHRRLALASAGQESRARSYLDERWLGFSQPGSQSGSGTEFYSWNSEQTQCYFPGRVGVPTYSFWTNLPNKLSSDYDAIRSVYENGTNPDSYPIFSSVLGWAHPWGVAYGGMTGGTEIHLSGGTLVIGAASSEGYLHFRLRHRGNVDRSAFALFHPDGEPVTLESLEAASGTTPTNFTFSAVDFAVQGGAINALKLGSPPSPQEQFVAAAGMAPSYESALLNYKPHDLQHSIRYTNPMKTLVWLGNDPLARDDLRLFANLARLALPEVPNASGAASGVLAIKQFATNNPGVGATWARAESWALDAIVASYATGDDTTRALFRPFIDVSIEAISLAQVPCTGAIEAKINSKFPSLNHYFHQFFEHSFANAVAAASLRSVYEGTGSPNESRARDVLRLSSATAILPVSWTPNGPRKFLPIRPAGTTDPNSVYCDLPLPQDSLDPTVDKTYSPHTFAWGFLSTADSLYLTKAAEALGGGTVPGLQTALQGTGFSHNAENHALLLWTLQKQGWTISN